METRIPTHACWARVTAWESKGVWVSGCAGGGEGGGGSGRGYKALGEPHTQSHSLEAPGSQSEKQAGTRRRSALRCHSLRLLPGEGETVRKVLQDVCAVGSQGWIVQFEVRDIFSIVNKWHVRLFPNIILLVLLLLLLLISSELNILKISFPSGSND